MYQNTNLPTQYMAMMPRNISNILCLPVTDCCHLARQIALGAFDDRKGLVVPIVEAALVL